MLKIEIITVGPEFAKVKSRDKNHFNNITDLKGWFGKQNFKNTFFLLKGSRGLKLERLLQQ